MYNKKRTHECEDAPPEKKLVSEADLYIKKLAEKQRNTTINLEEQLSLKNSFCKSTELVSLTNFASGSKSLQEFSSLVGDVKNLEELKSRGLTDDEIELIQRYHNRHKKINHDVLKTQLGVIYNKLGEIPEEPKNAISRLESELLLATKPTSVETKLLKFALENEQKNSVPGPLDQLKSVEQQLMTDLAPVNVKKIRKKARRLGKQINSGNPPLNEPEIQFQTSGNTKWDLKDSPQIPITKTYTCDKPPNYYTIKDGQIIQINQTVTKLSLEEIRNLPKFQNYDKGTPSNVLFLKNLANGLDQSDLETIFQKFAKEILSIRVMTGLMQGQAFIEAIDEKTAAEMLDQFNGLIVKNKPIIIQFGRKKTV
ncbi:RNA-binding protein 41 [Tribolium castaneum]|uniref:RNA-binding protein 41-like Protein n=1 Tax=Tribolium castaneum TaxID=7070 RepID=D2A1F1_TRICA|nr:PREDICTED: RNA-binding protein 41 [Tribolium castaneum]EFA02104.2 RNA-binding protein 41-like Protein [Tribolium castaneum]|eukprot:XP_008191526.1 PREDICTED: RNA-binding protein 41 [Tribolium castaneum]